MNISAYSAHFHDGCLFNIERDINSIRFFMASAEMDEDDLEDDIPLSEDNAIHGILHLERVQQITVDELPFTGTLRKLRQTSRILDFEWRDGLIMLLVKWSNYPYKIEEQVYQMIEVKANKIWWENIPNLWDEYE